MKINALQFNHRAEFGEFQDGEYDRNGQKNKSKFVPKFKLWFGYRKQTLNQQYTLLGLDEKETKVIAIRHNNKVYEGMYVRIDGEIYKISVNSQDMNVASGTDTYDVLTLFKRDS